MSVKEVPSDHDFFDPAYVKQRTESIGRYRPERKRLFEVFAAEAAQVKKGALLVFELGCGPGFLAEALLKSCQILRYTLLDFSPQMLELSRSRLRKFDEPTLFIQADFKMPIGPKRSPPASISSSRSRLCTGFATRAVSQSFTLSSIAYSPGRTF